MPRVGFFDSSVFDSHDAGAGHPERPERLQAVRRGLREAGLVDELVQVAPRPATREELLRVHGAELVEAVAATQGRQVSFDADTAAGPRSYEAALLAVGAAVEAVERVRAGGLDRAFCAVRPPGHHATRHTAMGFCLFNNVAVAAAAALEGGLERVAILDFDVHHGNGTQDIFWDEPRVLFVSSHQVPLYPGTGSLAESGGPRARGLTVNLPMPPGCGDAEYAAVWRQVVLPIARAFAPQLVLVSCGFDAHRGDPLAGMDLTDAGYAALADVCLEAAAPAKGRVVMLLEGGYDLDNIAGATRAVVGCLLDRRAATTIGGPSPEGERLAAAFRAAHSRFWPLE
ncbi:MAG TPA: histone deacetylase [Vicinamibacteria bacterium]|nr:histone deacetylase [Vicinamibacteria bacterium]